MKIVFLVFVFAFLARSEVTWAVKVLKHQDVEELAARDGFVNLGQIGHLKGYYRFKQARIQKRQLRQAKRLEYEWFSELKRKQRFSRLSDPLWSNSWYINGNAPLQGTMNVEEIWKQGYTGLGVHVGIIDDGIEGDHPELKDSFVAEHSFNFLSGNRDASPKTPEDNHGTRCAGQIAGKRNNSLCSAGIAPDANITAIKIIGTIYPTDADEAAALNHDLKYHDVYSSSWGPKDDGMSIDGPGRLAKKALRYGTRWGRQKKGVIYVFASGNGGLKDNCNFDGYANSPYTISVGGLQVDEKMAFYSEPCSAHLIMSYGGSNGSYISTSDLHRGCTSSHTGTSAAAPLVSGIIALLLQKRPDLNWRDVQHLLVHSAVKNDILDDGWSVNRAGHLVSHKYAFGVAHGNRLLELSDAWISVPVPQLSISQSSYPKSYIPLHKILSTSIEIRETDIDYIEHILVQVRIQHPQRGRLKINLLSPETNGIRTISELASLRPNDNSSSEINWTFSTVHHWDELPLGKWTLEIEDTRANGHMGRLVSWGLEVRGRCSYANAVMVDSKLQCKSHYFRVSNRAQKQLAIAVFSVVCLIIALLLATRIIRREQEQIEYDSIPSSPVQSTKLTRRTIKGPFIRL